MEEASSTAQPKINVVLVHPEIPPNTGNIARMCGATRSVLHLVHPLGFKTDDRHLRRAGLDYWDKVEIVHHKDLHTFLDFSKGRELIFFSTRGVQPYTRAPFEDGCYLVFGSETRGLPEEILERFQVRTYHIPIWGDVRSLNLATAVGVVTFEAYRQLGFGPHHMPG